MVPAIDARWPPCRGESGIRIKKLGVVARVGIEPTTRGFSVQRRGAEGARKPKTGKGFSAARPNRPPRPNRFRALETELRTEPAPGAMRVKGLRAGGPNWGRTGLQPPLLWGVVAVTGALGNCSRGIPRHRLTVPTQDISAVDG
jgi:hypothetical protein